MNRKPVALTFIWVILAIGCNRQETPVTDTYAEGDGVYVRLLRLEVASDSMPGFEAMMKRMVDIAESTGLSDGYDWLCYREQPGFYWILSFSNGPDEFAVPAGLAGLAESIGSKDKQADGNQITGMLAILDYEPTWEVVLQLNSHWSTVAEMTTRDHPKARMIHRTYRNGQGHQHAAAVLDWTNFLKAKNYPLPIEGFVVHAGPRDSAWQVVFPRDWKSFEQKFDFPRFVESLNEPEKTELIKLKTALDSTVSSVELYDGSHAPELSFAAK